MIRINLLAVDRERTKRRSKFPIEQKATIASSLILLVAVLTVGWWYWSLRRESADLEQRITDAELERTRLQSLIQQVQEFEAQRGQLQQRVSLIEQLRQGQTGPVHLLDQISRALPETMWLTELQQDGTAVTIDGRCTSLTSLSDFIGNLERSGYFTPPVEIVDSLVEPATAQTAELIRFTVKGAFAQPKT